MEKKQYVYLFNEGNASMKNLLGGKGANLSEMTILGIPVPQGFTVTTEACNKYYEDDKKISQDIIEEIENKMSELEKITGKKFGSLENPLLVSVRSGARVSMPGMMDTILNLGLNDESVEAMAKLTNNPRFAYDSYRRFIQMFADVVMGVEKRLFEDLLDEVKEEKGYKIDTDLTAEDLKDLVVKFKALYKKEKGEDFPSNPKEQLIEAVTAVFRSWNNPRAIVYRRLNDIPGEWGTAVNVQEMVFGNKGETSGTGVAFSRNPANGDNELYGEYLMNAQGEDVVAGIRTPEPISHLEAQNPTIYKQFTDIVNTLEKHSKKFNEADEIFNAVESIVLPMYNLENYSIENIKFKNTDKNRAVYKLIDDINNPKNTFCLKKVYYDEGTLLFIYSVMEWFARNEIKLPKMLPSKFNGRFVKANNMLFMLCPWVKGEKCNFDNLQHILLSIENLAKMHNCSRNFKAIEGSLIKTGFDSLYISTLKHFNKILSSFNTATKMKHKDKFSSIFLDVFDENIYLAKEALLVSGSINDKNLSRSLCHGDYVNKNILIDNTDVWVIDFDKASLNYSMYDLCYFMRRLLKRSNTNWDIDLTRKIIKTYNSIAPLTEDDFKYVFSYLAFPQKYWRLSKDYYNNIKKCNKSMFVESLKEVSLDTYAQVRFVGELRTLFSTEFKIKV